MKFFLMLFLLVLLAGGWFYWFQYRPSQIKHECSWVKQHSDAVPARPAMTKDELIHQGIIRSCKAEIAAAQKIEPNTNFELGTFEIHARMQPFGVTLRSMSADPIWEATSCIEDGDKVIVR